MKIRIGAPGTSIPPVDNVIRQVQRNEADGYADVWWPDHLMSFYPSSIWTTDLTEMVQFQENPNIYLDAFATIAAVASQTQSIGLGTCVTEPVRHHPAVLAQTFLTLDHISEGRFIAGLGAGEAANIVPYGLTTERSVARLEESLKIIRLLWSTPEPVDYEGRFWTLKGAVLGLRSYQEGRYPPIWLAAHGPRMLDLTAHLADGWIPQRFIAPEEYGQKWRHICALAERYGRDPESLTASMLVLLVVADSHELCHRLLDQPFVKILAVVLPEEKYRDWAGVEHPLGSRRYGLVDYIPEQLDRETALALIDRIPFEVAHRFIMHGTAEEVAETLGLYAEVGLQHAVLWNMTVCGDVSLLRPSFEAMRQVQRMVGSD